MDSIDRRDRSRAPHHAAQPSAPTDLTIEGMHSVGVGGGSAAPPARGCSEDGRCGAAALRLDKRKYLDREQGRWRIVLRDYGDGLCEVGWSFVAAIVLGKAGRGQSEQRELHEDRASRRARSRLRQLILATNADHLLTLTYRANITDFRAASADLGRFIRRVRTYLPGWVYIAVPERQKRGAWHWHLAVFGRQDVDLLRSCWRDVVGEGNIDVQQPKRGAANRRLAIVKYLGKYLAKGFAEGDRELNGHRFRASLGIKVPGQLIEVPPEQRHDVSEYVIDQLRSHAGSVGYVWIDQQGLAGWARSWS